MLKVVKVRLYPNIQQQHQLACTFGAARWWWNYALNKSIETYKDTGKGLRQTALNALLPPLKKAEDTSWLGNCYSQVLQATTLNLTTAYKNFFGLRAGFPRFKLRKHKQSIQYPQNVKVGNGFITLPKMSEAIKAKIHRPIEGEIKTVTVSQNPSGKYFASILFEIENSKKQVNKPDGIEGIDLGIKHFAITFDGKKVSKAATNIYAEGIRMLQTDGTAVSAAGGDVRPKLGRKTRLGQSPMKAEASRERVATASSSQLSI
jgi:putative transposase